MTGISRIDKLNLFKRLLKYSNQLIYTDKHFYLSRVKTEFNQNKYLTEEKDIKFFYEVPVLKEKDLKEEFIHGSGPGGQNVNKLSNCVQLTHLPTGIVVKCHQNREQHRNRVIARELLTSKLDDLINKEQSVSAQRLRIFLDKQSKRDKSREKVRELKKAFKEELKRRAVLNSDKDIENDSDVSRNN